MAANFNLYTPATEVNAWLRELSEGEVVIRVHKEWVAYRDKKNKEQYLKSCNPEDAEQFQACGVVGSSINALRSRGGLGLFASDLDNITGLGDQWHTVAIYRKGQELFVYDPAFSGKSKEKMQVKDMKGWAQVRHLRAMLEKQHERISAIHVHGVGDEEAQCLRLASTWLEKMAKGEVALEDFEWTQLER